MRMLSPPVPCARHTEAKTQTGGSGTRGEREREAAQRLMDGKWRPCNRGLGRPTVGRVRRLNKIWSNDARCRRYYCSCLLVVVIGGGVVEPLVDQNEAAEQSQEHG